MNYEDQMDSAKAVIGILPHILSTIEKVVILETALGALKALQTAEGIALLMQQYMRRK